MNTPTREEVDTKLVNLELRIENRLAAMEGAIVQLSADLRAAMEQFRSLKVTIILTGISSVFAVAGLNYAMISNVTAAYDSGKNSGKELAENTALLRQIQAQLNARDGVPVTGAVAPKK